MLYRLGKNVPRGVEIIAGTQQAIDLRAIFGPLLDLVKIAVVRTRKYPSLTQLVKSPASGPRRNALLVEAQRSVKTDNSGRVAHSQIVLR